MKLSLRFGDYLCCTHGFNINGVNARSDDFGEQYDESPEEAEDYCCGNMVFKPRTASPDILEKYGITEQEYNEIAKKLEEGLSFGPCGWCS